LLVALQDFEGEERFEFYESFAIGEEDQQYILQKLGANGTAGDSLRTHYCHKFTTFDDIDIFPPGNCAAIHLRAW